MFSTRKLAILMAVIMVFALGAVAFAQGATPTTAATGAMSTAQAPGVIVNSQPLQNGAVTVQSVNALENGWIDIHVDESGAPGAGIGQAQVKPGLNQNVVVNIDVARATPTLWAMLHVDRGQPGVFEFPGADVPVLGPDGKPVQMAFQVTGLPVTGAASVTPGAGLAAAAQVTGTATMTATATTAPTEAATATTAPTAAAGAVMTATATARPSTLPTTGGNTSSLVVLLLGLGAISLLGGLGISLARRPVR